LLRRTTLAEDASSRRRTSPQYAAEKRAALGRTFRTWGRRPPLGSLQIRAIFAAYTPIIEPLSLDEAYLDVTENLKGIVSATQIAETIRAKIRTESGLTASAGVSYNKFLANGPSRSTQSCEIA
jgi:nucleotidyltransferase/DNA polymerase involved in DNA repair